MNQIPDYIIEFDGGLALLTIIGLFPNLWSFYKKEQLNPLERRLSLMTTAMAIFFLLRALLNLFHFKFLVGPTYTVAILMMVATCLYFETLLRRHFPRWFKYYLTLGCTLTIVLANTGHLSSSKENLMVFGVFVLSIQIAMICFALFRNKTDYTHIENTMIFTGTMTLVILAPMFMTDVTTFNLPLPKMGVLAALIFSYVSLFDHNMTRGIYFPLRNLVRSGIMSLLFILPFFLIIENREFWFWSRFYIAVFGFGISFRIFYAVNHLNLNTETGTFLEALNSADKSSVMKFLLGFKDFYDKVSLKIVRPEFLKNYDAPAIERFMEKRDLYLLSRDQLQIFEADEAITPQEKEIIDQVHVLLETNDMTHLLKVGKGEVYYVLLGVPLVQYQRMVEVQAQAICQTALLIQARQKSDKIV